jgi:hypothetical protein
MKYNNMKTNKIIGIALVLLLVGCKKDKESIVPTKGDVYVTVKYNDGTFAENASVFTKPKTVEGITDKFGTVLLKGIEKGSIEIIANVGNFGSGKTVAEVIPDDLVKVEIEIIQGISDGISPQISITSPTNNLEYSVGDTIVFSAIVTDESTPSKDIGIVWESNIDSTLNTESPNENGIVSFTNSTLSKGLHVITLTAEDLDGYKSIATINISTLKPQKVQIKELIKAKGSVKVSWTKYKGDDFAKYYVYRSTQGCYEEYLELIGEVNNIADTIFFDETPPMEYQACYAIKVTNTNNLSRLSDFSSIEYPGGIIFNFVPDDMLKHPTENFVYLISKSNKKLVKYDYVKDSLIKEISLQGTAGYCDIGDNGYGVELYVPSSDGHIYIYDANDLSLELTVTTDLATASVVVDGNGYIIATVDPDPWWDQPIRTYSRSNGLFIDGYEGNGVNESDRLRLIPGTSEIISISTTVSPVDMEYYKIGNDGTIEEHYDDSYHGDYSLDATIFRISDDGSYAITAYNGSVYLANSNMAYQGNLQNGGLQYSDFAFSPDGKIIYAATKNRKSVQIGHYPALITDNEIQLNGYPKHILRDGDKLIVSVTSVQGSSIKSGIEIVEIP